MASIPGMKEGAPFNSAVDTLMRISDILKDITKITIGVYQGSQIQDQGQVQETKYRLVNMLRVMATPLLKKEQVIELNEEWNKIELFKVRTGTPGKGSNVVVKFSPEVENKLDEFTIDLQFILQEEGYFMPPKGDPRFAFAQD